MVKGRKQQLGAVSESAHRAAPCRPRAILRWWMLAMLGWGIPSLLPGQTQTARIGYWANGEGGEYSNMLQQTTAYLSQTVPGYTFVLKPLENQELIDQLQQGQLDFVFLDPALYVQLEAGMGIKRLATAQRLVNDKSCAMLGGTVITLRRRTDIVQLEHLRGKSFMSVRGDTLGAWLAVLREFLDRGFDPQTRCGALQFVGEERAVIDAVAQGTVDAGAVRAGVLETMASEKIVRMDDFQVLYFKGAHTANESAGFPFRVSTRLYPEWAFAACPKAPRDLAQQTAAALLTMPAPQPAARGPNPMQWSIPDSYVSVHDCLKDLRRPPYEDYGKINFIDVVKKYMYWFLGAGALMVIMMLTTSYVTRLNHELVAEIEGRKQAEGSLRESVERFQHVVSCSMDWIWEADAEGRFTYSSNMIKEMLGLEPAEIIGQRMYDLFATSDKEEHKAQQHVIANRMDRMFREKFRLLTKEGRLVIHELSAAPVMNPKGKVIGYRGVNRDVTAQVRYVRL